jgi:hypothetical protein
MIIGYYEIMMPFALLSPCRLIRSAFHIHFWLVLTATTLSCSQYLENLEMKKVFALLKKKRVILLSKRTWRLQRICQSPRLSVSISRPLKVLISMNGPFAYLYLKYTQRESTSSDSQFSIQLSMVFVRTQKRCLKNRVAVPTAVSTALEPFCIFSHDIIFYSAASVAATWDHSVIEVVEKFCLIDVPS